jgi:cellulose synthase/poly-beta-1,6-N-acetylglucosamine synthase-like glycosyltransferase
MIVCYGVFSFFAYVAIPPIAHSILWYILALLQTMVTLTVLTEALHSVQPNVQARRENRKAAKIEDYPAVDAKKCPHIDVVLVAYLPNEQDIILSQAKYAARELNYPKSKFTVNVVYNTPHEMQPIEDELRALERDNKNVRIIKAHQSTSKAENINFFLRLKDTRGEITSVLDTDHFCEPNALRWIAKRFSQGDVDIVQGRCCIYNVKETWLTRMVAAEFDTIYGVFHPGRASLHGYGLFGGSNGHWNSTLLRTLKMDEGMLTEDIDSTLRALTSQARVVYDLKVISYEQAPTTLAALVKQRLRWSQGWTQVTIKHTVPAMKKGAYGTFWRSRLGLFFLLTFREIYFHLLFQLFFLIFSSFVTNVPSSWHELYESFVGFKLSVWMLCLNLVCIFVCTCITLRNKSAFVGAQYILLFGLSSPLYFTIVSFMAVFGHFREFAGYKTWNVTKRKQRPGATNIAAARSMA